MEGFCQQEVKNRPAPCSRAWKCNPDAMNRTAAEARTRRASAVRPLNRWHQLMPHTPKAIILAAGSGSRLLPHTAHSPKCLTPINGQPILRYQIAALRECGIEDIVIVVGYLAHCIRDFVDSSVTLGREPRLRLDEQQPLAVAGAGAHASRVPSPQFGPALRARAAAGAARGAGRERGHCRPARPAGQRHDEGGDGRSQDPAHGEGSDDRASRRGRRAREVRTRAEPSC